MPPARLLVLVVAVLVAGCAGFTDGGTSGANTTTTTAPTTTTIDATTTTAETTRSTRRTTTCTEEEIAVCDGSLSFDHVETWNRVESLVGVDADPPPRVVVRENRTLGGGFDDVDSPFFERVTGVSGAPDDEPAERVTGIALSTGGASPEYVEYVLAHEYVHSVQFQHVDDSPAFRAAFDAGDHQTRRVSAAIIEGGASYVATEYAARHFPGGPAAVRDEEPSYRDLSPAGRYAFAPYHFGRLYVTDRAYSPADHWRVYEDPPNTTEQLLHNYSRAEEPPRALSVSVSGDGSATDAGPMGELFVRLVLASHLPEQDAADAAAGWGADRLVELDGSYAWVLRWDDAANASAFEDAFERFLDERADRRGDTWTADGTAFDVRRPGDDTAVVLVGDDGFVGNATVAADGSTVEVAVEE